MDLKHGIEYLKSLGLPADQFMVVSSGALAVRGIREARDIDLIVTESLWDELAAKYPVSEEHGVERIDLGSDIDLLNPKQSKFGSMSPIPLDELLKEADVFYGVRFINLKHLQVIKQAMGREKDLRD